MSTADDLRDVAGEIHRFGVVSDGILTAMDHVFSEDIPSIGRSTTAAMAVAGLLENYYTAVETVLFRIAQSFGNNLRQERWHSDLLHRMVTAVPTVRPRVISELTRSRLDELMRFRHFKRYYFNLDYDWSRLEHLVQTMHSVNPAVRKELAAFDSFISSVISDLEPP